MSPSPEQMPTLFVLDAPEFRPIVEVGRGRADIAVKGPVCGYYSLSTEAELRIDRAETGLTEALWFGAVTGGYRGADMSLDSQALLIRADASGA